MEESFEDAVFYRSCVGQPRFRAVLLRAVMEGGHVLCVPQSISLDSSRPIAVADIGTSTS